MAGVGLRTVQKLMGHKTISMTIRYSHLAPSHQKEAMERIVHNTASHVTVVPTATRIATKDFEGISEASRKTA
jgi:hypothetical protein